MRTALLGLAAPLGGCTSQMTALTQSMTSQAANLLFMQERLQQEAALQREQGQERQQQLDVQCLHQQNQP